MNSYLIVSAITFLVFGFAWNKNNWYNFVVKIFFIGLGFIGLFYFLIESGYVIKQ